METITLTNEELKQLEWLLKKGAGVYVVDAPFYGAINTIWIKDKIDRIDKVDQRKIGRGKND